MRQRTRDELDAVAHTAAADNSEQAARKSRLLETQHEEMPREIEKLMNDVQLRNFEIKNLQKCVAFLLREKNDLENKVKVRERGRYTLHFRHVNDISYVCHLIFNSDSTR